MDILEKFRARLNDGATIDTGLMAFFVGGVGPQAS